MRAPCFVARFVRGWGLEVSFMDLEYLIGGVVALLLTIYLVYALLRAERF